MISDIVFIIAGTLLVVFRKKFAIGSLEFQRKAFGIKYGKKDETSMLVLAFVVGTAAIGLAVFDLLKG